MKPRIINVDSPTNMTWRAISDPLTRYQDSKAGKSSKRRDLVIALQAANRADIVGGLWGTTEFSCLQIELLFVPLGVRNCGLGTQLLDLAEQEAIRRGCLRAWVEVYSFSAPDFYEHRGYARFGELADFPVGHSRIFMQKLLTGNSA